MGTRGYLTIFGGTIGIILNAVAIHVRIANITQAVLIQIRLLWIGIEVAIVVKVDHAVFIGVLGGRGGNVRFGLHDVGFLGIGFFTATSTQRIPAQLILNVATI